MNKNTAISLVSISTLLLTASAKAQEGNVNVYNYSDYIGSAINDRFQEETGVKVVYDVFDSSETASTKLLVGKSGYDVVVTGGAALVELIEAGALAEIDKDKLPNLQNLDVNILRAAESFDPGHRYGVPYFWGTTGVGYNVEKIRERAPDAPLGSLAMVLDPQWVSKFADCGVAILDTPEQIFPIVLNYLGLDPHSENQEDYDRAVKVLEAIRPHVRYFHSSRYVSDIANGDICLAIGWSGDFFIAQTRAKDAGNGVSVGYSIPQEGTIAWLDNLAIPVDAPNPTNALAYINFLLDADVAAENAAEIHTASPNKEALATGKIPREDLNNAGIYPPTEVMAKLFGEKKAEPQLKRLRTRLWTRVSTGQ